MRLVTTTRGVGVLDGDAVRLLDTKYADIGEALSAGLDPEALAGSPVLDEVPLEAVTLRPPVLRPSKIWGVGYAYADHRREVGFGETPTHPMVFLKAPSSVIACNESIVLPLVAPDRVDYEGELGVVIGRRASSVARADAAAFVAGYTVVNDVTARDIQRGDIPGRKGDTSMAKSLDTFTPLGPCLTTLDEFDDPDDLELKTFVSGDLRQNARTSDLIFPVSELIEYLSSHTTLQPGDIITTGTPAGVGHARSLYLRPGDTVSIWIEGIGTLTNPVVAAAARLQ